MAEGLRQQILPYLLEISAVGFLASGESCSSRRNEDGIEGIEGIEEYFDAVELLDPFDPFIQRIGLTLRECAMK